MGASCQGVPAFLVLGVGPLRRFPKHAIKMNESLRHAVELSVSLPVRQVNSIQRPSGGARLAMRARHLAAGLDLEEATGRRTERVSDLVEGRSGRGATH